MRFIVTSLLLIALAGCAGTDFSYSQARQVQLGMTESQVTQIMGRPYSVISRTDGQMWVWSQANGFTGSSRAVSFKMQDGRVVELPSIPNSFE